MPAFALADLKQASGKQNMGGLLSKAWFLPVDHLDPAQPLPALSAIGKLDTAGDLVLLPGKKWIELYSTPAKNGIDSNSVGEVDGMSKENIYDMFYPGGEQACAEFEAFALNTPALLLIPDTNGNKRLIGLCRLDPAGVVLTADMPAHLVASNGSSGKERANLRGQTFQWKASAPHAPLYYLGAVDIV